MTRSALRERRDSRNGIGYPGLVGLCTVETLTNGRFRDAVMLGSQVCFVVDTPPFAMFW